MIDREMERCCLLFIALLFTAVAGTDWISCCVFVVLYCAGWMDGWLDGVEWSGGNGYIQASKASKGEKDNQWMS